HLSWRWVFYVNLPLGLVVLAALALAFPNIRPRRTHRGVDYRGAALLVAALVPLLLALTWGGSVYAWTSPEEVALLAVAIAMGALFLWNESRVPEPILPLSLFRNHIVGVSLAIVFLSAIGMFGAILFIPLFIQGVLGGSATTSGNVLTPMMLSFVAGSVVSGQIVARRGRYKLNATVGLALMTVGALLLSTMDVHTGYGAAVGSMVVVGIGLGATMPVFTLAVQNAVPYAQLGVATSATQFFRSIGGSVGAAILGGVLASRFAGALPAHLEATLGPERMSTLSPEVLHAVANPQALFAAGEHGGAGPLGPILAQLGPQGADVAQGLVLAIRLSLAEAIRTTFLVSVGVAALCFALSFLLREVPLRKTNHLETAPTPAAGDGGVATTPRGAAPHEAASARHPSAE
ncbi:MAG TPA: MFS transporter, partial [Chloroflexota bacterium]